MAQAPPSLCQARGLLVAETAQPAAPSPDHRHERAPDGPGRAAAAPGLPPVSRAGACAVWPSDCLRASSVARRRRLLCQRSWLPRPRRAGSWNLQCAVAYIEDTHRARSVRHFSKARVIHVKLPRDGAVSREASRANSPCTPFSVPVRSRLAGWLLRLDVEPIHGRGRRPG